MKIGLVLAPLAVLSLTLNDKDQQAPFQVAPPHPKGTPVPGDSPVELCTESAGLLDIDYINLTPNPPVPGQNLTIEAAGTVKKLIEQGAYVELDVKYGYIRLLRKTVDLCEQTSDVDMACPIQPGFRTIVKNVALPEEIPPGKYIVSAHAFTADDEEIVCMSAQVVFDPFA